MKTNSFHSLIVIFVPAVIALAMVGTLIYLTIFTEKEIPPSLSNLLAIVIAYYFGKSAGASPSGKGD